MKTKELLKNFAEAFGHGPEPRIFFAPGRVNLIGEHIDYNGGYVFPAALTLGITAVVRPRTDGKVIMESMQATGRFTIDVTKDIPYKDQDGWANYPKGVLAYLKNEGHQTSGFDVLFSSNLPNGAGLSSSAALEVLTAYVVLKLKNLTDKQIDRVWLASLCQKVENEYVNVNCGIMDQFAVANGKKDMAILLDCQTLGHKHVPVVLEDTTLVIMNTAKRRELAGSKYNERRAECEAALKLLQKYHGFKDLCEVDGMYRDRYLWDDTLFKRARHVIKENLRVLRAVTTLGHGDLKSFGMLLIKSHQSLKVDYEVTGFELDTIVRLALEHDGCLGARMTGAGFGGCAIALVSNNHLENFKVKVGAEYNKATGLTPEFYESHIGEGVHEIEY